jgi:predicted regulator of Ras-like GTPase activity (Roadblock/LC7/MglB family)
MDVQIKPSVFEEILERMNDEGNFSTSVLASEDGLPVAAAPNPPTYDADTIAAMVTLVKDFIQQTQQRLGLAEVDEVSVVVGDRSRLVCRYFKAGESPFVLAIVAPPHVTYRRLTTRAIRELQEAWG